MWYALRMSPRGNRAFVGRERELEELTAALRGAAAGRGGLRLIVGEPGIGKTRLADEVVAHAEADGIAAFWGRCWEAEGRPPYWPWVQILRALRERRGDADWQRTVGGDLRQLAQLLPELGGATPRPESESARFHLFDATCACLARAGRAAPLLLVLDDLHAADLPSLRLLEFAAHALADAPVLMIGTFRPAEARHDVAVRLGALPRAGRQLPLAGLSPDEVGRFLELAVGQAVPAALAERIHRTTEGNPFFVDELVRGLHSEPGGWPPPDSAGFPLSHGVRGAIRQRLAPLPAPARELLAAASVIGRDFDLSLLAAARDLSVEMVLATLAPALERELLVRVPGIAGGYRFAHALVRETLHEELPPAERVSWHRRLAQLLEQRATAGDVPLSALAHHFFEAAAGGGEAKAVEYAERAGREAMRMLAYEEATEHYGRAVRLLEYDPGASPAQLCELLLAAGEAHTRAGADEPARLALRRAAGLARRLGAGELLARAAIGLCASSGLLWTEFGRSDAALIRLMEEALASLGPAPTALRARVMTRLASELCWASDPGRADQLSADAVDVARRAGDAAALAYALLGRLLCASGPHHLDERRPAAAEILALSNASGDREPAVNALMWQVGDALQLGDAAALRAGRAALVRAATDLRQPADLWIVPAIESQRALFEGRFADAEALAEAMVTEPAPRANAAQTASALLFLVRREQGRLAELEGGLKGLVYQYPAVTVWRASLAVLYAEIGREPEGRAELEGLVSAGLDAIPRDLTWLYTMSCLARTAAQVGSEAQADALHAALLPFADRHAVAGPFFHLGPVAYYLGLLAARSRRWEEAEMHMAEAERRNAGLGDQPCAARILVAWARITLTRAAAGDAEAAQARLAAADAIARRLGMDAMQRKISRLMGQATTAAAAPAPHVVLRRDGDVWMLAHGATRVHLRDRRGLHYLVALLREPGREFHVLDLAGAGRDVDADLGPALDAAAKQALGARLRALRAEVEDAEQANDPARAGAARAEIDQLGEYIAGAVGLGGRDRRVHAASERARASVTKALRAAIGQIGEHHPSLARELRAAVRTGTFCVYEPDQTAAKRWDV